MFGFFERGTITITPEKFNYAPGETIKGNVSVALKKPIVANGFSITLEGDQISTVNRQPMSGGQTGPQTEQMNNIIFTFTLPLDGSKEYLNAEYPFEIVIPQNAVPASAPSLPGILGGGVSLTIGGFGVGASIPPRVEWYLHAALDIPGAIDMRQKVQVNIG